MRPKRHHIPLLLVRGLKKTYADGTTALKGIDFAVHAGEIVAIIGPSGAGKSTLLRCINRLVEPTEGDIIFDNIHVTRASRRQVRRIRREIGMIFQSFNLVERVTVLSNVLHGRLGYMNPISGAFGWYSKKDEEEAIRILKRVGLQEQIYKRADELSGGQQQRVGIARALSQKPRLILADEPIASLDPVTSETVMRDLYTICKEDGITCLINLHQVDVAKKWASRIIGIHNGTIVFDGPPSELTAEQIDFIYRKREEVPV